MGLRNGRVKVGNRPWLLWVSVCVLLLAACETGGGGQDSLVAALERKYGLIAYVGLDGNIYTINQGGGKQKPVTSDGRPPSEEGEAAAQAYLFPTWSREGRKLAFAGIRGSFSNPQFTNVLTAEPDGDNIKELFRSETEFPLFLYWSPDGETLGFLTSGNPGGLTLRLAESGDPGPPQAADVGPFIYWAWAPVGEQLLIHAGDENNATRISVLTPQERVIEEHLDVRPDVFQAPAWSPDGRTMVFSAQTSEEEKSLVLYDWPERQSEELTALESETVAFAWSPDGGKVAYIAGDSIQGQGVLGRVEVIDVQNPDQTIVAGEETAMAFYWSPNSEKLAYFVPTLVSARDQAQESDQGTGQEMLVLALFVLDVGSGETERLNVFQPTPEFFNSLRFFDQFHRATTIWSPDSRNLVVAAMSGESGKGIWVVNASGRLDPRLIADGALAVWSWE